MQYAEFFIVPLKKEVKIWYNVCSIMRVYPAKKFSRRNRNVKENVKEFNFDYIVEDIEEESKEKIVKRKNIEMKPMDEEESTSIHMERTSCLPSPSLLTTAIRRTS